VACPTKLIEYMLNGIIPIVLNPYIGDFKELGYSYISLERLEKGDPPSCFEIVNMRVNNLKVIEKIRDRFNKSLEEVLLLKDKITECIKLREDIFLTTYEVINSRLITQVFINTGQDFNQQQSLCKDIYGYEKHLEFDLSAYSSILSLRIDPLYNLLVLKITNISIITSDNILQSNLCFTSNAFCKKDNNIYIFITKHPQIYLDVKHINSLQKIFIDLEYIATGNDVYEYIFNEITDIEIEKRDRMINRQKEQIKIQEDYIKKLSEKEEILNHIYNSQGWKVLNMYYKLRDFLLPANSGRWRFIKFLFQLLLKK